MKYLFWAIGFFCMFLAVHASIAGDSVSFIFSMLFGIGAVSTGMGLQSYGRYIESVRRLKADTERTRGQYERLNDGQHTPLDPITPDDIYPLWQKCNRCNVYLAEHGTAGHPWEEWAGEPDDDVEVYVWGQADPIGERQWTAEQKREYRRQVERNRRP